MTLGRPSRWAAGPAERELPEAAERRHTGAFLPGGASPPCGREKREKRYPCACCGDRQALRLDSVSSQHSDVRGAGSVFPKASGELVTVPWQVVTEGGHASLRPRFGGGTVCPQLSFVTGHSALLNCAGRGDAGRLFCFMADFSVLNGLIYTLPLPKTNPRHLKTQKQLNK